MTQHSGLDEERWSQYPLDRQILMIANEMNRARKLMASEDNARRQNAYERVLRLTDLTVRVNQRPGFLRELLRWRDLIAQLYIDTVADAERHNQALRCLLAFTRTSYGQIALLFGARGPQTSLSPPSL